MQTALWLPALAHPGIDRRAFLRVAAGAGTGLFVPGTSNALAAQPGREGGPPRLIPRQQNPDNLESPFASLNTFITSNNLFYVRNHFAAPNLDSATWRLRVEGALERPLALSLDELRRLPARTVTT